ncbi:alpha/beta fold hydrolase [Mycobacterium sp. 94-17]|uniref:alpha/beta fold hydrolase n=1 Tax=Mycobacterium sp. 94-17 TaxID=2986147 RepID=UPI002D1EFCD3|nr:alpha/beta fold hydrolase [Mycobacterium sp. 94-17]MEB4209816.1 alpha/beta fold hydrolase [Mycobacterium sp. 94-17]
MALPALVLVHGGGLAADSWELTIHEIHRLAPDLTVLALDMPGRRGKPGNLRTMSIADCVDSLVGDVESARLTDIIIVGHSIGGMTLPGMASKLGTARVRELIFAASFLPPEGATLVDSLPWLLTRIARRFAKRGVPRQTPSSLAGFAYLNGVPSGRRHFMRAKLYPESLRMLTENVSWRGMPADIPRTWILTLNDRAIAPQLQRRNIEALGGVQTLVEIDTCHMVMVSEPLRLADILVGRCRLYA